MNIAIIDFRIQISDIFRKTIFTGLYSSATMLLVVICRDLWCTKLVRLVQSVEMEYHAMLDCVLKINGNWKLLIGKWKVYILICATQLSYQNLSFTQVSIPLLVNQKIKIWCSRQIPVKEVPMRFTGAIYDFR